MTHVWNDHYGALYDRTYRVLYDAGVDEKLAHELATQHTLAVLIARANRPRFAFSRSIELDPPTKHLLDCS
jgi:hypothetical protein